MTKVIDIYDEIDRIAPFDTQMDFDRAGFLVGSGDAAVTKALLALDITPGVISEAAAGGFQLIITHHPVIWDPIKRLMSDSMAYQLARADIAVISAHTNFDAAQGGVCDCLAAKLGLKYCRHAESVPVGTVGDLSDPVTARQLAQMVKTSLCCGAVRFTEGSRLISRVAVIGGAGADFALALCAGEADALVTGEAKHNELVDAANADVTLIAAGHYETENIALPALASELSKALPDVRFAVTSTGAPALVL